MGTTLVDSLDTLWLFGMKEEFWEARNWVRDYLSHDKVGEVSLVDTTIRNLGGLLSAYDLSGDSLFLRKADDLGRRLMKAFGSLSGIPYGLTELNGTRSYNIPWMGKSVALAEAGTLQLEFLYLAKRTGKRAYATVAERAIRQLQKMHPTSGLYPLYIRNDEVKPKFGSRKLSFGAMGDCFYEYLLKVWVQGGKREKFYKSMFDSAIDGLLEHLIQTSQPSALTYVAEMENGVLEHKMDHLSCYLGGGCYSSF